MLAMSYKGFWIVKDEPKSLGVSLGAVISRHVRSRVELGLKIQTIRML
jgi:hypothetical protein